MWGDVPIKGSPEDLTTKYSMIKFHGNLEWWETVKNQGNLHSYQQCTRFQFLHILILFFDAVFLLLLLWFFFNNIHLGKCAVISHWSFICTFLMISEPISHLYILFGEILTQVLTLLFSLIIRCFAIELCELLTYLWNWPHIRCTVLSFFLPFCKLFIYPVQFPLLREDF